MRDVTMLVYSIFSDLHCSGLRQSNGFTSQDSYLLPLAQTHLVWFLPPWLYRLGCRMWRKLGRQAHRNDSWTCTSHRTHCCSLGWGCSNQAHRSIASPQGCTCVGREKSTGEAVSNIKITIQCGLLIYHQMADLPRPANKGWGSTCHRHYPGEYDANYRMGAGEFEAAHGFADHDVSLNSQYYQGPQSHLTCTMEARWWWLTMYRRDRNSTLSVTVWLVSQTVLWLWLTAQRLTLTVIKGGYNRYSKSKVSVNLIHPEMFHLTWNSP